MMIIETIVSELSFSGCYCAGLNLLITNVMMTYTVNYHIYIILQQVSVPQMYNMLLIRVQRFCSSSSCLEAFGLNRIEH